MGLGSSITGTSATGAFANKVRASAGVFLSDIVQISVGRNVTLALSRTGTVYAWGQDNSLNTGASAADGGKHVAYATPVVAARTLAPCRGLSALAQATAPAWRSRPTETSIRGGKITMASSPKAHKRKAAGRAVLAKAPATQGGDFDGIKAISAGGIHQLALTSTGGS